MRVAAARPLDLLAAVALACAAVAVAFVPAVSSPVRVLLALPLVFVLPGYAFTAVAFTRNERWSAEGAAFTLGSSLALTILTGLVLNYTPGGLERRTWAVALAGITVVAATVGFVKERRSEQTPRRLEWPALKATRLVLFSLAFLVTAAALGISRLGAIQAEHKSKFTQLWMLPTQAKSASVQIGIANDEGSVKSYRLVLRAGNDRLESWPSIVVRPGERWVKTIQLPHELTMETRLEADLYRAAKPGTLYRRVTFQPQATP